MTVEELIPLLQKANPKAQVVVSWYDDFAVGDGNNTQPADVGIYEDEVIFS